METDDRFDSLSPLSDEQLAALFRSVEAPAPRAGFTTRTLRAVKRSPLPHGRRALGDPLASLLGWAAVFAGVSLLVLVVAMSQPIFANLFSALVSSGVGIGVWLMQLRGPAVALFGIFETTGTAVARAASTAEGTAALLLVAVTGAISLSALHRLLAFEGEGRQWQELS